MEGDSDDGSWSTLPSDDSISTVPSYSSSEEEKKQKLWFYARLDQTGLLQKALRPLFQLAYTDREYPEHMFVAGKMSDVGNLFVSPNGVVVSSTSSSLPHLRAYLDVPAGMLAEFRCRRNLDLSVHLRHLEKQITALDEHAEADGISMCFAGVKPNYDGLQYYLRDGHGNTVHHSPISLIMCNGGSPDLDWYNDNYAVAIDMPAQIFFVLIESLILYGNEVQATVSEGQVMFRTVNKEIIIREEHGEYRIVQEEGEVLQYPFVLTFGLHHMSALLNAASLSERVYLLQLMDLRTVLQVPVRGLGSILFI